MAVSTLFIPSIADLKAQLRLSGAASSDGLAMINGAVQDVRIGMIERIGQSRVNEILSTGWTDNPSSEAEITRVKAGRCEVAWTRLLLMRRMPVLFFENAGQALEPWNEESLARENNKSRQDEINRLEAEVEEYLYSLGSGDTDDSDINASTLGPDVTPQRPGDTVRHFGFRQIFPARYD